MDLLARMVRRRYYSLGRQRDFSSVESVYLPGRLVDFMDHDFALYRGVGRRRRNVIIRQAQKVDVLVKSED